MNAITFAPNPGHMARVARNRVRARLGTARGTAPVRRKRPGEAEDLASTAKPMPLAERRFLMQLLEDWAEAHRGTGDGLTPSALKVARTMLFYLMDRPTGLIEHAYGYIAERSRRAYQTACAAVRQLEDLQVLKVQRRSRKGDGPDAPPWVQDINLYRFVIPPKLMTWWRLRKEAREARARAWMPEDAAFQEEEAERRRDAWEAQKKAFDAEMTKAEIGAGLVHLASRLGIPIEDEDGAAVSAAPS